MSDRSQAIREAHAKGYRVNELGQMVSARGHVMRPNIQKGRPYPRVSFQLASGKRTKIELHRFVAFQKFGEAAFEPGIEARHLDGDSLNSRPDNIAIGTGSDNAMDKTPETRRCTGLNAAKARRKLTPDQAREIVLLNLQGWSGKRIAEHFGTLRSTVSEILSGKIYSEATGLEQRVRNAKLVPEHLRDQVEAEVDRRPTEAAR